MDLDQLHADAKTSNNLLAQLLWAAADRLKRTRELLRRLDPKTDGRSGGHA